MENCFTEEKMDSKKGCKQWLKRRTHLEKTLMSICVVLFLTCTLVILFGITFDGKSSTATVERTVCSSDACIQIASSILKKMDPATNPCEDFYEFSCGRYLRMHEIPDDFHERSVEQTSVDEIRLQVKNWLETEVEDENIGAFRKAKILYSTCMNFSLPEDDYRPFLERVYEQQMNDTWPVLDSHWEDKGFEKTIAALTLLDVPVAFRLEIVPDARDSSKYIARLSPGEPLLDQEFFQGKTEKSLITSYTSMVVSAFMMLGLDRNRAVSDFEEILSIERELVGLSKIAKEECGQKSEENPTRNGLQIERFPLSQLHQRMPSGLNWKEMMKLIFSGANITDKTEIEIYCGKHIWNYAEYILSGTFSAKSTMVYLGWRFLFPYIQYLGQPFHRLHQDYSELVTGRFSQRFHSRWKECVVLVEQRMLPVVAAVYGEQEVTKAVQDSVEKILKGVKTSFEHFLTSARFLSESERNRSKQKLSRLGFEIALMNYSRDLEKVDRIFSQLTLADDHLFSNIVRLQSFKVANRLQKILSPHKDGLEWKQSSLISSDSCQSNEKVISLQYDKIRPPVLFLGQPSYLNYGAFGVFLSHEITHVIGNTDGNTRDEKEKTILWDLEKQSDESICFAKQYLRYTIDKINAEVDGWRTLNENIADNSAMQIAYQAYEHYLNSNGDDTKLVGLDFTNQQMFFLSFAQMFCQIRDKEGFMEYANSSYAPSRVRVNAVLSNLRKFGEVYKCAENTPMNPTKKCVLW